MPSCLPPETKPIIAGAAGGGGGGSPVDGKMLAAAGGGGATPDKMSLAACGRTPGTNCGFDMFLPGRVGVGWVWWARGCCRLRGRPRGRGRGITNDANLSGTWMCMKPKESASVLPVKARRMRRMKRDSPAFSMG